MSVRPDDAAYLDQALRALLRPGDSVNLTRAEWSQALRRFGVKAGSRDLAHLFDELVARYPIWELDRPKCGYWRVRLS